MARRPKLYILRKNYGDFQPERGVNPTSAYGCGGTCGGFFGGGWGRCNKGCKCRGGLCVARNRREEQMQYDMNFAGYYATGIYGSECNPPCNYAQGERCENGVCLPGDPTRKRKPPLYSYQEDDPNLRQVGGGCAPLCGTPPNCRPCGSTGPTYPQKQIGLGCETDADCGPGCFCDKGQCYCAQPSARQNVIARCDSYSPNCPGPKGSANYRSKNGQCCSKGAPRQTSTRRRR